MKTERQTGWRSRLARFKFLGRTGGPVEKANLFKAHRPGGVYVPLSQTESDTAKVSFESFLDQLENKGWEVSGQMSAFKDIGEWQIVYLRHHAFSRPQGQIGFNICVRARVLRDLEMGLSARSKNPFDYPYRFTAEEVLAGRFKYPKTLLRYEESTYHMDLDWRPMLQLLEQTTAHFQNQKLTDLYAALMALEAPGHIEKIWLEDLERALAKATP